MSTNLLYRIYKKEMFNPGLLGFFINPFFIIRRGLYRGVKMYSSHFSGKMLDFGCGSKPYKSLFDVEEYIGLDIEEKGHSHAREQIDVYYDGQAIPFDDETFDGVFSSEVFEHIFNLEDMLNEIHRVTKKKGLLLITVPFVWDEHEVPFDYARYSSFGIKALLERNGFEVIKSTKSNGYVTTIFQMWNAYLYQHCLRVLPLQILLTPFLVMPFTLLGIVLSLILPRSKQFFHNNIVLAKKD